jgi:hypothetical protein
MAGWLAVRAMRAVLVGVKDVPGHRRPSIASSARPGDRCRPPSSLPATHVCVQATPQRRGSDASGRGPVQAAAAGRADTPARAAARADPARHNDQPVYAKKW